MWKGQHVKGRTANLRLIIVVMKNTQSQWHWQTKASWALSAPFLSSPMHFNYWLTFVAHCQLESHLTTLCILFYLTTNILFFNLVFCRCTNYISVHVHLESSFYEIITICSFRFDSIECKATFVKRSIVWGKIWTILAINPQKPLSLSWWRMWICISQGPSRADGIFKRLTERNVTKGLLRE